MSVYIYIGIGSPNTKATIIKQKHKSRNFFKRIVYKNRGEDRRATSQIRVSLKFGKNVERGLELLLASIMSKKETPTFNLVTERVPWENLVPIPIIHFPEFRDFKWLGN